MSKTNNATDDSTAAALRILAITVGAIACLAVIGNTWDTRHELSVAMYVVAISVFLGCRGIAREIRRK